MTNTNTRPARGRGQNYGTRECKRCGSEFKARTSRHATCDTCRTVRQAASMRNEPAKCRGCQQWYHRRDGHDYFCPDCHVLGLGDTRFEPDAEHPLARCKECEERNVPSIDPAFPVCAACVATAGRPGTEEHERSLRVNLHIVTYLRGAAASTELSDGDKGIIGSVRGVIERNYLADDVGMLRREHQTDNPDDHTPFELILYKRWLPASGETQFSRWTRDEANARRRASTRS